MNDDEFFHAYGSHPLIYIPCEVFTCEETFLTILSLQDFTMFASVHNSMAYTISTIHIDLLVNKQ